MLARNKQPPVIADFNELDTIQAARIEALFHVPSSQFSHPQEPAAREVRDDHVYARNANHYASGVIGFEPN